MKNEIQIIQVQQGTDVHLHTHGKHAKQIANAPGGIIEFITLDTTDKLPVERVRFDSSCYNLFVVNEPITTNGSFTVREEVWLKNSLDKIPNGLSKECLSRFIYYPAVLVRMNERHRVASADSTAAVALVFNPKVGSDRCSIRFNYIIIEQFSAQALNDNEEAFGIMTSGQSNEIDRLCWEIKDIDVLKLLGLTGGHCGEEQSQN